MITPNLSVRFKVFHFDLSEIITWILDVHASLRLLLLCASECADASQHRCGVKTLCCSRLIHLQDLDVVVAVLGLWMTQPSLFCSTPKELLLVKMCWCLQGWLVISEWLHMYWGMFCWTLRLMKHLWSTPLLWTEEMKIEHLQSKTVQMKELIEGEC